MLTKRIIPCLDIKDGRTVKGVNFVNLRDAGDPVELAQRYAEEGADELVFLDISASEEKRKTLPSLFVMLPKPSISPLQWAVVSMQLTMLESYWTMVQTRSRSTLLLFAVLR